MPLITGNENANDCKRKKNINNQLIIKKQLNKKQDLNEVVQIFNLKNSDAKNVKTSLD